MPPAPQQLTLDLALRPALDAEDFLVSASNAAAIAVVDAWPDWQHWAVVVSGPEGAGKSHLANVWRSRSGAACVEADAFDEMAVQQLVDAKAIVVENLERGVREQKALFHALNLAREHKYSILLTSRTAPGDLDIELPDLRSRLRALPHVAIEPPDEALLHGLLVKLFADRQLTVEPQLIAHLVRHMERSASAAQSLVAEIDRRALETHRKVSRALATEVLAAMGTDET